MQRHRIEPHLPYLGIVLGAILVYGGYLHGPLFFDDFGIIDPDRPVYEGPLGAMDPRWFPYASFRWTQAVFGDDVVWLRVGNLFLHMTNGCVLYAFLRRLFEAACPEGPHSGPNNSLSLRWIAFFGALLFTVHPVATYGVAYLIQRTIVVATLFALLTWWLFLEGMLRNSFRCMLGSALCYLISMLGKEHAFLVPVVSFSLLGLIFEPGKKRTEVIWLAGVLYVLAAGFILYRVTYGGYAQARFIGQAYEGSAEAMLAALGISASDQHPLSVLTQSYLFFKYLLLWLVPNPSWMSVAMEENFARSYFAWPQALGPLMYVAYAAVAICLLVRRGRVGLLGFAMLVPAALFSIEFSVVRIQEVFVLYRSYLWMPCVGCSLPFVLKRIQAKLAIVVMLVLSLLLAAISINRMDVFVEPLKLWDEALQLAKDTPIKISLGRLYHNRGLAYLNRGNYDAALTDLNAALRFRPNLSNIYNDRAVVFLEKEQYMDALADYNFAVRLNPKSSLHYFGRARTKQALGWFEDARRDLLMSCRLGRRKACEELHSPPMRMRP